jgi:hypothetical protein
MGALPVTARRAKRENGGLGEDAPGSTMMTLLSSAEANETRKRYAYAIQPVEYAP